MFMRGQTLLAQRFDAADVSVVGDPFSVAEGVVTPTGARYPAVWPQFSSSANGVLTYQGTGTASKELVWFDRSGRRMSTVGEPADYSNPALSPNEELLAISRMDPTARTRDVWVIELARNVSTRLTFHSADDTNPVWAPDNRRIAFTSTRNGPRAVYVKDTSTTREDQLLARFDEQTSTMDWSADGRFIVVGNHLIEVDGNHRRIPLPNMSKQVVSRDSNWIAYQSTETGRTEVFVQSLSAISAGQSSRKWPVSTERRKLPPMAWRYSRAIFFKPGQTANRRERGRERLPITIRIAEDAFSRRRRGGEPTCPLSADGRRAAISAGAACWRCPSSADNRGRELAGGSGSMTCPRCKLMSHTHASLPSCLHGHSPASYRHCAGCRTSADSPRSP